MALSSYAIKELARKEFSRLNREIYEGKLKLHEITTNRTRSWGTFYAPGRINISSRCPHREAVLETVRHEVAHLACRQLVGPNCRHGPIWKQHAILCGATPTARTDENSPHAQLPTKTQELLALRRQMKEAKP